MVIKSRYWVYKIQCGHYVLSLEYKNKLWAIGTGSRMYFKTGKFSVEEYLVTIVI